MQYRKNHRYENKSACKYLKAFIKQSRTVNRTLVRQGTGRPFEQPNNSFQVFFVQKLLTFLNSQTPGFCLETTQFDVA
jgi:hypothetical protein